MGRPSYYTGKGCAKTYWTNSGVHFGYPKCCIDAFLDEDYTYDKTIFTGTGYVPCNKCNKRTWYKLVEDINKNRKHPLPFPNGDGFVENFREKCYGRPK